MGGINLSMSSGSELALAGVVIFLGICMICYYIKAKKRFSKLFFGVISGLVCLYPASLIVTALGGLMNMNLFTMSVAGVLGIPGVAILTAAAFM